MRATRFSLLVSLSLFLCLLGCSNASIVGTGTNNGGSVASGTYGLTFDIKGAKAIAANNPNAKGLSARALAKLGSRASSDLGTLAVRGLAAGQLAASGTSHRCCRRGARHHDHPVPVEGAVGGHPARPRLPARPSALHGSWCACVPAQSRPHPTAGRSGVVLEWRHHG